MVITSIGCIGCDNLVTAIGGIVGPLALLSIVVSDIIKVILLELIFIGTFGEGLLPEEHGFIQGYPD